MPSFADLAVDGRTHEFSSPLWPSSTAATRCNTVSAQKDSRLSLGNSKICSTDRFREEEVHSLSHRSSTCWLNLAMQVFEGGFLHEHSTTIQTSE